MTDGKGAPAPLPAARALARDIALPFAAGAMAVAGFAPFYVWQLPLAAFAALFFAWSRAASKGRAALSGYVFGLGLFLAGVSWVYVSLHDFGGLPAWLAGLATFLLCAFLAVFPALAGWATARLASSVGARPLTLSEGATLQRLTDPTLFEGAAEHRAQIDHAMVVELRVLDVMIDVEHDGDNFLGV